MLASASRFTIFPMQDLFGWHDRINTPATWTRTTGAGDCRDTWTISKRSSAPARAPALLKEWTREAGR